MSLKPVLMATIAMAATLTWQSAAAQASAPVSREQRKAETAAANKAGELTPAGGGAAPVAKSTAKGPTKSREQTKSETAAANRAGELTPAGGGAAPVSKTAASGPTKTREQRKAETMEAKKKGELRPPGQ
jgi:hypothetical protein